MSTSRYERRPNDIMRYADQNSHSYNSVYGARPNHISPRYVHEPLPSKPSVTYSNSHSPSRSSRNPAKISTKTYDPSRYTYSNGYYEDEIVRPTMQSRHRTSSDVISYKKPFISSMCGLSSYPRSNSLSPTSNKTPTYTKNDPSRYTYSNGYYEDEIVRPTMRSRHRTSSDVISCEKPFIRSMYGLSSYPRSNSLSPTSHPSTYRTRKDTELPASYVVSPTRQRSSSSSDLTSIYSRGSYKKEVISIDKKPYDSEYTPSFSRTTSPKRSVEVDYEVTLKSHIERDIGCGVIGLRNIGNTCFMNSMLQCLSNTKKLRDYCLKSKFEKELNRDKSPMKGKLMTAFSEVILQLWKNGALSVNTTNFKSQIQKFSPRFMGYEQQDSQEFLRFLLEGLHEDINQVKIKSKDPIPEMNRLSPKEKARQTWMWYATKDKSFVFDLFVGQLESSLTCLECNHKSLTYDPFWDLSLPISKSAFSSEATSVVDCLRNFTKEEVLDRDEKPTCERCKTRRKMTKKLSIHKFPKVLVIHLKRFNEGSRYRQKLTNLVKFPMQNLNLENYASDHCENRSSALYDLYAVSNHCGSCYGGHYTAYCCNPDTRQWHDFNDSQVTSMSSTSVCTKEAYVLFYTQKSNTSSARL